MPASDPITPEPHRFSIRLPRPMWIGMVAGLLIVVVIALRVGVPIYRRLIAIREIDQLGSFQTAHTGPVWLRAWIGDDRMRLYYEPVTRVRVFDSQHDEKWMKCLEVLPDLQDLVLNDSNVTDGGLQYLRGLTNLKTLSLVGTHVTDAGLAHLKGMPNLESIWVSDTDVTGAGLLRLGPVPKLSYLEIEAGPTTNADIAELERVFPNLRITTAYSPGRHSGFQTD